MQPTVSLTVIVADGHQSTISAEFIRMRQNESTSSLRYGYVEYDTAISSLHFYTDSQLDHNTGRPT